MKDIPPLRDYQIADLAYYIANPRCMNLSDPGTGKTPSVCVMQFYLWNNEQARTAWAMPKALLKKNLDELIRFTPFTSEDVAILDGPPKKVTKILESGKKVLLMGFDRYSSTWTRLGPEFKALHVDEIHMGYGGHSSKRTEEMIRSTKAQMKWFLPMTGTLVNGRLDTAFPSIHVIEPRYYPTYWAFKNYHAIEDADGKIIGWKNHQKLSAIFARHAIRRTFEQVYGPESKVIITEVVKMNEKQREVYDEFGTTAMLELENFYIDGTLPGVAFIRARQIMEHPNEFPNLVDKGRFIDIMPGHTPAKEDLLEVHLNDHYRTKKPLVIFSALLPQHRRIAELCQKIGLKAAMINSTVSDSKRAQADVAFRAGELDAVICSPACAAVGFNWQLSGGKEVDHMIFVSLDFKDTTFLQAYRRAMRDVRKTPLRITVMEYENSLDQRIFEIVREKSVMVNKVDASRPKLDLSRASPQQEVARFASSAR